MKTHITLLLATAARFAIHADAAPTTRSPSLLARNDGGWAKFYDDDDCKVNGGIGVSMGNHGCLANEHGRRSIRIDPGANMAWFGSAFNSTNLVWSPGNNCECQNRCQNILENNGFGYCLRIGGESQSANSFRFITQDCDQDNCYMASDMVVARR